MIKPMNNHCLIEVKNEYDGLVGAGTDDVQSGTLIDFTFTPNHLTTSTGYTIEEPFDLDRLEGKTVYWQEYADMGSKFTIDGKNYVLVPFYRLIGFED